MIHSLIMTLLSKNTWLLVQDLKEFVTLTWTRLGFGVTLTWTRLGFPSLDLELDSELNAKTWD